MVHGEQFVTTAGEQLMLLLYADNWDSLPQVVNHAQVIEA